MTMSSNRHEPIFDIHPVTGVGIEVFYADTSLISFGKSGAGWFWQVRRRGRSPDDRAKGPFPTRYPHIATLWCPEERWLSHEDVSKMVAVLPYCFHRNRAWKQRFRGSKKL